MECISLGTGGMMPMPQRLTTSVLVRHEGRMLMFDAGEGIQLALKKGSLGIRALDSIVVSHLHADHVLGIPGIMMFRAQNDDPGPLTIFGPPGIDKFIRHILADLRFHINFTFDCVEWKEGPQSNDWLWNGIKIIPMPLNHSTFCLGFRLEEPMRPGKFHPERALELGIPSGPLFGELQAGISVTTATGNVVHPKDVLGPERQGRIVVFATDTSPCENLQLLMENADIAFVEGMFALEHEKEASKKKHMTAAQAAIIASRSNVKRLVLVHISPRYSLKDEAILEAEAKMHFQNVEVARPLAEYPVPFPESD